MSKKTNPIYTGLGIVSIVALVGMGVYWACDFLAGSFTVVVRNDSGSTITDAALLWTDDKTTTKIDRINGGETFRLKHRPKRDGHVELTFFVENEKLTAPFGYMTPGLHSTEKIDIDDKMIENLLRGKHPHPLTVFP